MTNPLKKENEHTIFQIIAGGPLKVSGTFKIQGPDGKLIEEKSPLYLCRCGHSSNKPFCSGEHKRIGFSE
ncbi:MAG: CDGSH iron-sulfur domain-containing protein [Bacteroidales bacterium]|nr:CDGSH iron-sulfur domain-containing protein [Bacteroidales bacterium]